MCETVSKAVQVDKSTLRETDAGGPDQNFCMIKIRKIHRCFTRVQPVIFQHRCNNLHKSIFRPDPQPGQGASSKTEPFQPDLSQISELDQVDLD